MIKNKPVINMNHWTPNKCNTCGADGLCTVCSSLFGASSYAYCQDCFELSKEPYYAIVSYIASAGRWPEDINIGYQREVRRQLKLHNKPEEDFAADIEKSIAEEQAFFSKQHD